MIVIKQIITCNASAFELLLDIPILHGTLSGNLFSLMKCFVLVFKIGSVLKDMVLLQSLLATVLNSCITKQIYYSVVIPL